ncbi:hypothetical protein B0H19DRAFT_1080974 [Mycena capillaripes]|nr:hypothetical protein B0H19DRAFT_1080974 [Mycena capillaripes]
MPASVPSERRFPTCPDAYRITVNERSQCHKGIKRVALLMEYVDKGIKQADIPRELLDDRGISVRHDFLVICTGKMSARGKRTKGSNDRRQEAYSLAKAALQVPQPATVFVPHSVDTPMCTIHHGSILHPHKIVPELEEAAPEVPRSWKNWADAEESKLDENHRERAKEFWDFVRKRTDPRPKKSKVALKDLADNFKDRLNYPAVQPVTFNSDQLAFNARMARELEPEPLDTSPRQSYTCDITLEDIEWMKRHITEHGLDTAVGVDRFSYKECLKSPREIIGILLILRQAPQNPTILADLPPEWNSEAGQRPNGSERLSSYCTGMLYAKDAHLDNRSPSARGRRGYWCNSQISKRFPGAFSDKRQRFCTAPPH